MEKVLDATQTNDGKEFRPQGDFVVSLHGTFTGDVFVYFVPDENIIPEADRVAADWVKMHKDPITPADPVILLACARGYICQVRAANAGAIAVWTHETLFQFRG